MRIRLSLPSWYLCLTQQIRVKLRAGGVGMGWSGLNEIMYVKYLQQCLSYKKCSKHTSCYNFIITLMKNIVGFVQTMLKSCDVAYTPRRL